MDNLSKYLEDISFISWVFEPTPELNQKWNRFEKEHPGEAKNIELSRKIINQFRTVSKTLSEADKILLFSRVLKQIENRQKSKNYTSIFIDLTKYAAIAILFFAIGALLFYKPGSTYSSFSSINTDDIISGNQAQLIRSNGENILLGNQRSVIKYQKTGELVVNNDTLKSATPVFKEEPSMNQLIIPYGRTSEVMLPDGTKVFLNAGSRLVYPDFFTGKTRDVFLSGEAYFEVKHDSKRPFIVQVNDLQIKDLGTRFNVSAYSSDIRVETVLTEGKVSIRPNNSGFFSQSTKLIPGQLASFDRKSGEISVKEVNIDDYTLWIQGMVKFETVDLSRIVKKLERFYNIRVQFDDPMLGGLKISGKLELKDDMNEVLERVARTASVNIVKKGDDLYEILK